MYVRTTSSVSELIGGVAPGFPPCLNGKRAPTTRDKEEVGKGGG